VSHLRSYVRKHAVINHYMYQTAQFLFVAIWLSARRSSCPSANRPTQPFALLLSKILVLPNNFKPKIPINTRRGAGGYTARPKLRLIFLCPGP